MNTRKILSAIGTFAVVGAVSTAGAALWTKVLNRKFQMVQLKLTHPKSDKIIFVDFKKAKRAADAAALLFFSSAQKAVSFMETKLFRR